MTPLQYAKACLSSGKFIQIWIAHTAGVFWLEDNDGSILKGPHFTSREAAEKARSNVVAKALKAHFKHA